MSKLIYAKSKTDFETAYSASGTIDLSLPTNNTVYRSVVFTEDGYLYTHGKYFRILNNGTSIFTSTTTNGTATLKDANNVSLGTIDVGVTAVVGGNLLSNSAVTNGSITIDHDTSALSAGTYGPGADSSTTISVPYVTTDAYGHITATGNRTATLNYVLSTVATSGTGSPFYLLGHSASTTGTAATYKISTVYADYQG
jgi:hypothetical protein